MTSNPYIERLKRIWERPGVKVVTEIPKGTRAHEVSSITYHIPHEARITIHKDRILYLVSIDKDRVWDHIMTWKEEIRNRKEWVDRVEDWECSKDGAFSFDMKMDILKSRLSHIEKRAIEA